MATITFNKFDLGIDHRKGAAVSDANRLVEMKNAHVTTGLATEKRPGLKKVATLEAGTKGLFPAFGKLHTFYGGDGTITHANELFEAHKLICAEAEEKDTETADETDTEPAYTPVHKEVTGIDFVDVFNGYLYVAAEHGEERFHHYRRRNHANNRQSMSTYGSRTESGLKNVCRIAGRSDGAFFQDGRSDRLERGRRRRISADRTELPRGARSACIGDLPEQHGCPVAGRRAGMDDRP